MDALDELDKPTRPCVLKLASLKNRPAQKFGAVTALNYGNLATVPFKRPRTINSEAELYEYAVGALSRRMRTVAELKRLLRRRVSDDEAGRILVEMVVLRLKEHKYLNDANYAAAYSAFRRDNEKFGQRRVITELKARGIHGDVIDKAVTQAYSEVNEEKQARAFLKRKRLQKPSTNQEAARIFRALMRAGFHSGMAIKILKNWDVDDEVLSALQEEGPGERES